jgi:hypothetical protein
MEQRPAVLESRSNAVAHQPCQVARFLTSGYRIALKNTRVFTSPAPDNLALRCAGIIIINDQR